MLNRSSTHDRTDEPADPAGQMHLAMIISDLACGGAQRVLTRLAGHWTSAGHHVTVITLSNGKSDFFQLPPKTNRVALDLLGTAENTARGLANNLTRIRRLRGILRRIQPDAVVSFSDKMNVLSLLAGWGLDFPIYVSERSDPRHKPIGRVWAQLRRLLYPRARGVIVLTSRIKQWMTGFVPADRIHVIPNPVPKPAIASTHPPAWLPLPCVVSVGRLAPEKRFDLLIRAFAACDRPDWSLVIMGEGPERDFLEKLTRELGVSDKVILPGITAHPEHALQHASIYVLSSSREGFPNAMAEAMATGLPVVTVDYPAGPGDIVRHGIDGFIVPPDDIPAISGALITLMDHPQLRKAMGERAKSVTERFNSRIVMEHWNGLLKRLNCPMCSRQGDFPHADHL